MWLLRLKNGVELTEQDLGCWDNVPADAEIAALAIAIPREGATPYIIEWKDYERYCCARIGQAAQGAIGNVVGYSVNVVKAGQVLEHDILCNGMKLRTYVEEKCAVPARCFRRGSV